MLLANGLDSKRIRATKGGSNGICPECHGEVIPKCGEIMIWHWAHKVLNNCEYSLRGETDWHLAHKQYWLDHGAEIEVPIGSRRADVVYKGVVIEFQRANETLEKITSRTLNHIENGYKVMWVFPKEVRMIDPESRFMQFMGSQTILGQVVDRFPNKIVIIIEDLAFNEWYRVVKFYYTSNSKAFVGTFNVDTIRDYFEKGNFELLVTHGRYEVHMPFGKHKGKPLTKVPTGYFKWLMKNDIPYGTLEEGIQRELINRKKEV